MLKAMILVAMPQGLLSCQQVGYASDASTSCNLVALFF